MAYVTVQHPVPEEMQFVQVVMMCCWWFPHMGKDS